MAEYFSSKRRPTLPSPFRLTVQLLLLVLSPTRQSYGCELTLKTLSPLRSKEESWAFLTYNHSCRCQQHFLKPFLSEPPRIRTLQTPGTAALTGHGLPICLDASVSPSVNQYFQKSGRKEHAQVALLLNHRRTDKVQTGCHRFQGGPQNTILGVARQSCMTVVRATTSSVSYG